jgi:hypothetical protein
VVILINSRLGSLLDFPNSIKSIIALETDVMMLYGISFVFFAV